MVHLVLYNHMQGSVRTVQLHIWFACNYRAKYAATLMWVVWMDHVQIDG